MYLTSQLTHNFEPGKEDSISIAVVRYVEESRTPCSFELCVMKKKKGGAMEGKKTNKLKFLHLVFSTLRNVIGSYGVGLAKGCSL